MLTITACFSVSVLLPTDVPNAFATSLAPANAYGPGVVLKNGDPMHHPKITLNLNLILIVAIQACNIAFYLLP